MKIWKSGDRLFWGLWALAVLLPLFFHWSYVWGPKEELRLFNNDTLAYSYWWSYFYNKFASLGQEPLWNPYISLGYPALAQISNVSFYPPAWGLVWAFDPNPVWFLRIFNLYILFHFSLAAAGVMWLAKGQGISPLGGFAGAMVWTLSSAAANGTDGFEWLYGLAWAPWALHFLLVGLEKQTWRPWLFLGLVLGILYSTNFLPVCYYVSLLLTATLLVFHWGRWRPLRPWLGFGLAHLLAVLIAAPTLGSLLQLVVGFSERTHPTYAYAMSGLNPAYLLDRFFSPMDYQVFRSAWFGFGAYLLALIPLFVPAARPRWFKGWMLLGLVILVFGSGTYLLFTDFFYLFLPGYKTQHWHHRTALYLGLPLAILVGRGLDFLKSRPVSDSDRRLVAFLFGFLALACALAVIVKFEVVKRPELHGYFVVLAISTLLWLWSQGRVTQVRSLVVLLMVLELGYVFRRMESQTSDLLANYPNYQRGADQIWAEAADLEQRYFEGPREMNALGVPILRSVASVRGYVTPALRRIDRFHLYGFAQSIYGGKNPGGFQGDFFQPSGQDLPGFVGLATGPRVLLLGNAEVFSSPEGQEGLEYEKALLGKMAASDLGQTLWLERGTPQNCPNLGSWALERFELTRLAVQVTVPPGCANWLLWVDAHYPGWQVSLDGAAATLERADYTFKAVQVPPGVHQVVFEFVPPWYRWGQWVRWATLGGLLVGLGWWGLRPRPNSGG